MRGFTVIKYNSLKSLQQNVSVCDPWNDATVKVVC